uniref:Peptidase S1 domain-containing protein n=1 Tax=Amazona collaria TaxID=241587 RepID=A0A8B9G2B2_9PSIT
GKGEISAYRATCGRRPMAASHDKQRIVGGRDALPGAWPWIVSIQQTSEAGTVHMCGGSLISPQWVLTAAHCFINAKHIQTWFVLIGATRLTRLGPEAQVRKIRKLIAHPYYNKVTEENDIALLELDRPLQCNNYIQLICVPDMSMRVSQLTDCYISGWGSRKARCDSATVLQEAKVHLINVSTCNSSEWYQGDIHTHNLCAGYPQGGIDSCQVGTYYKSTQQHRQPGHKCPNTASTRLAWQVTLPPRCPYCCWGFRRLSHLQVLAQ